MIYILTRFYKTNQDPTQSPMNKQTKIFLANMCTSRPLGNQCKVVIFKFHFLLSLNLHKISFKMTFTLGKYLINIVTYLPN